MAECLCWKDSECRGLPCEPLGAFGGGADDCSYIGVLLWPAQFFLSISAQGVWGVIITQDNCHHLNDHHRNDDQEIPFYEWAGAPVYPEFEFQMFTTKVDNHCSVIKMDFKSKWLRQLRLSWLDWELQGKTKTRLILKISPYTIADLRRLEKDEWCFLYNE